MRLQKTGQRIVVMTLAFAATAILLVSVAMAQSEPDAEEHYDAPPSQEFSSVKQAQPHVPYPIRTPELPTGTTLNGVEVQVVPVTKQPEDLVIVRLSFTTADDSHVQMLQTNYGSIPWGDNQEWGHELDRTEVDIHGATGVAKTAYEDGDVVGGYLYWEYQGVIYQLAYPGMAGSDLVPIAETIAER